MALIKKKYSLLIIILFIGIILRVYALSTESIWLDEGYSIVYAKLDFLQVVRVQDDIPPLYYLILHWWIQFFGDSEFSVRFPSVIFGLMSIFMAYKTACYLFNKNTGILCSLIVSLSVFQIHYSQEARNYSLTALLTLLSMYFFLIFLTDNRKSILASYILFSALLTYSHVYGWFIIISQNIYIFSLFLLSRKTYKIKYKKWILIQISLIIIFAPWIHTFIIRVFDVVPGYTFLKVPNITRTLFSTFIWFSGSKLLLIPFILLWMFSIISYEKIRGRIIWRDFFSSLACYRWQLRFISTRENYFLIVWLLTPIILPLIISRIYTPIYTFRYAIGASLAFYVLVANGINNINHKYIRPIIIVIVTILSLITILNYYTKINKEQWRDVANYIDTNAGNEDLLLFNAKYCQKYVFDYYSKRTDFVKKGFPKKGNNVDKENIVELAPILGGYNRVWIILSHSDANSELIIETISKSYILAYYNKFKGIKLYFFEKKDV